MKRRSFLFALLAAAALAGCPGPTFIVQQYPGEARARETIAILRANATDDAKLLFLDDEDIAAPIAEDGRLHIELLPGTHTVIVAHAREMQRYPLLTFQAAANHVYRVAFAGGEAHVYEVDRAKDTLLEDVTIAPAPAPAALPPPAPPVPDLPPADPTQ